MSNFKFLFTNILMTLNTSIYFKLSFIFNIFLTVIKQILFLMTWNFFFLNYQSVNGWKFSEMLLMYGIVSCGIGIVEIFFDGLRDIPRIVETGQLDTYLLQPKNIIINLATSKSNLISIGDLVTGIIFIMYSGYFGIHPGKTVISIIISILFIFALYLYLGSIIFFLHNSSILIKELYQSALLISLQPNSAYKGFLKIFALTLLPVSFMSYYGIQFIKLESLKFLFLSIAGTISFFAISCLLFHLGLNRYESGSTNIQKD